MREQDLELGICFPSEEEELSQFSGRIKLKELTDAPEAGEKGIRVWLPGKSQRGLSYMIWRWKSGLQEFLQISNRIWCIFSVRSFPIAGHGEKLSGRNGRWWGSRGLIGACAESYMADLPETVQKKRRPSRIC